MDITSLIPAKYLSIFAVICGAIKVLQYVLAFISAALVKLGKPVPTWFVRLLAGINDVAINLPVSAFNGSTTPPVVGTTLGDRHGS